MQSTDGSIKHANMQYRVAALSLRIVGFDDVVPLTHYELAHHPCCQRGMSAFLLHGIASPLGWSGGHLKVWHNL